MPRLTAGEIREIYHYETEVKLEWTIPDFYLVFNFGWKHTPTFRCFGMDWTFGANSFGGSLYLNLSREGKAVTSVRFSVSTRKPDGGETLLFRDQTFGEGDKRWCPLPVLDSPSTPFRGGVTFIIMMFRQGSPRPVKSVVSRETQTESSLDQLLAHLDLAEKRLASQETQTEEVSDAEVKAECGLKLDVPGDPSLQKHLKDLLLTGVNHDITINVKNREFRAHRDMLQVRSPVFAAMFKHDTKESASNSISIDDCDPDAFGEFLNYIYTGRVEDLSPEKAIGLYYAADKYDFSGLKKVCVQFLESSLSKTSICDVISLAVTHSENGLLEKAINFFSENTVEILTTVEWQRFAAKNFVAANELCIKSFETLKKKK